MAPPSNDGAGWSSASHAAIEQDGASSATHTQRGEPWTGKGEVIGIVDEEEEIED